MTGATVAGNKALLAIALGGCAILLLYTPMLIVGNFQRGLYGASPPAAGGAAAPSSIPRVIIQTGRTSSLLGQLRSICDARTFVNFFRYVYNTRVLAWHNPGYRRIFFDDKAIESFLRREYPHYWLTYQQMPIRILAFDFFRYVAVYHYGGFYLDTDVVAERPFDALLPSKAVFPIDETIECWNSRYSKFCPQGSGGSPMVPHLLGQYAFAAQRNSPFLRKLCDRIHANIDAYITEVAKIKDAPDHKMALELLIYRLTGPDFVTLAYVDFERRQDVTVLMDDKQRFGKYAVHRHYGTWHFEKTYTAAEKD